MAGPSLTEGGDWHPGLCTELAVACLPFGGGGGSPPPQGLLLPSNNSLAAWGGMWTSGFGLKVVSGTGDGFRDPHLVLLFHPVAALTSPPPPPPCKLSLQKQPWETSPHSPRGCWNGSP